MSYDPDVEDFTFYGTPLEDEAEGRAGQPRLQVKDPAALRSLPVWKQEVTDAEGRKRFHGAFTGGYSAGYYNTVGSREGWAPSTFKSSRQDRTANRQQAVEDFLDEDELEEAGRSSLQTDQQYDTFGSTAAELARRQSAAAAQQRPSAIPDLLPEELIAPVADSVGIQLLQKMGWRQGKGIGVGAAGGESEGGSRWGRVAGVGVDNTALYLLKPKTDVFGLGFDPYKGAEDFRAAKRSKTEPPVEEATPSNGQRGKEVRGVAFGSILMDEDDTFGTVDDYVERPSGKKGMHFEVASDEEDSDDDMKAPTRLRPGAAPQPYLPAPTVPLSLQSSQHRKKGGSFIPGFLKATHDIELPFFEGPKVPKDFRAYHKFEEPAVAASGTLPPPPAAEPPADPETRRNADMLALFVARNGPEFESLARTRLQANAKFAFLFAGDGMQYYRWKIHRLKALQKEQTEEVLGQRSAPLSADERGNLLGEAPLPSTSAPTAESVPGQAPNSAAHQVVSAIAEGDKQRLQQVLQQSFVRGSKQDMGHVGPVGLQAKPPPAAAMAASFSDRFASSGAVQLGTTAGGLQQPAAAPPPPAEPQAISRRVEEWRPAPLLCKRFNVADPYRGRPAETKMSTLRTDYLALPETAAAMQALAQLPPQLVPPPQRQAAPQEAAASPVQLLPAAMQPAPALDSKALAEDFLSSLGMEQQTLPGPPPPPAVPSPALAAASAAPDAAAATDQTPSAMQPPLLQPSAPALDRPVDLFKAIFEAEDKSDEEEEEEEPGPQQPHLAANTAGAADGRPLGAAQGQPNAVSAAGPSNAQGRTVVPPDPGVASASRPALSKMEEAQLALEALHRHKTGKSRSKKGKDKEKRKKGKQKRKKGKSDKREHRSKERHRTNGSTRQQGRSKASATPPTPSIGGSDHSVSE